MLYSLIKKNSYQDSVSLMLLSSGLSAMPGVARFTAMMGTPPNKDIMRNTGLYAPELDAATPSDICIVVDAENEAARDAALAAVEEKLAQKSRPSAAALPVVRSWDAAQKALPEANLVLFSLPGMYVAKEAEKALDKGLNVFIFSDNVPLEDERRLKARAVEKGLLVMGPDCGTAVIGGVPLAFANAVARGSIGVVAASGTGLQEITTLIDKAGEGVSAAIGTGGRDLSEAVGGITMLAGLDALAADRDTEVLVVASKPPAKAVREKITARLQSVSKPVVAVFLGEKPEKDRDGTIRFAHTLERAAELAVSLRRAPKPEIRLDAKKRGNALKGLYSGGTLAAEAGMLLSEAFGEKGAKSEEILWKLGEHELVDLGEDCYTRGRPHPMIDPALRLAMLREKALAPETAVLLFDVVLGYGSHPDMGGVLAEAVANLRPELAAAGKDVLFVAALCGAPKDPQGYEKQLAALRGAGILVRESNAAAVSAAMSRLEALEAGACAPEGPANTLFTRGPAVINAGLRGFAEDLAAGGHPVVHYDWKPVAGGDERLAKLLEGLE